MSTTTTTWHIAGQELGHCNCDWGCPCQFNANPTHGRCEAVLAWEIRDGHYGDTDLSGARFAKLYSWPGAIPDGNGTRQMIVDESLTAEQRAALEALDSGTVGGTYFEIFAQVCPNRLDTVAAAIQFRMDRDKRAGSIRIGDIVETEAKPITNPVTNEEHRVRIDLPNGFEFKQAEIGNTTFARVKQTGGIGIPLNLENSYAQLNDFDWTNAVS